MDLKEEIKNRVRYIDKVVDSYLPEESGQQKTVIEAMNYSIHAGGKRVRPMLMLETFRLFDGKGESIEPFMAAMEMVHTYSLVHDDLPAMDDDEFRRGKKTTHALYGEAMGVLAGDGLLNYAYEILSEALKVHQDVPKVIKAFQIFSKKAGIYGMVGGQSVDIETDNGSQITREKLNFIYRLKTGALIESSMSIGAVLAGADEKYQRVIEQVAREVGLTFQIQDDILDVTSTTETLGKPVGSDEKNNKATYVTYEGLEKAKNDVETISMQAIQKLRSLPVQNDFLEQLLLYLIYREN